MSLRTRILLLAVLGLAVVPATTPAVHAEPALAWRLGLSDLALYDRRRITVKDGKERRGRDAPFTVHGHDLRDNGQYQSLAPTRGDLPGILAMRLLPTGEAKLRLALRDVVEVRGQAKATVTDGAPVTLHVAYTFGSRGRTRKSDTHWIRDGRASVRAEFDAKRGVLVKSRIEISYALGKVDAKPGESSQRVTEIWTYTLKRLLRARYDTFQKDVDDAIAKGVKHLRTLQIDDGSYRPHGDWTVGTTALAVLTMSACDVPRDDPAVEKGLAFICAASPTRTYALALALMALDRAYTPPQEALVERHRRLETFRRDLPPERRAWAERAAATLEGSASSPGTWSYPQTNSRAILKFDTSNSQYGVLGLRAAQRLGIPVKESTWTGVVRYFQQVRAKDAGKGRVHLVRRGEAVPDARDSMAGEAVQRVAGFRYSTREERTWGSMTSAGIACLSIARDQLERLGSRRLDAATRREIHAMILGGWAWLDANWAMDRHPRKPGTAWYYYYLYSLERAGILSGVERVGGKDWYFEGATQLIARQGKKGAWNEGGGADIVETCFALLFLKRATAPITPSSPR